ncbi:ATP-binding cassette domain-containing protein [Aureimonas altamirensis]|uniref:ABC transporter ATP-binding protein n=1 Tax=Aureimonas altamirensis TaxID=370622 RepID=UPI002036D062|nr:ATP-binding cassette domain-containing protein [Aureimonas altamirensis]
MLELKDIVVALGDAAPALDGCSLTLEPGERLLICGSAGAGKSTLASVAAGIVPRLVAPTVFSGIHRVGGEDARLLDRSALFGAVGSVAQNVEDQLWDLGVEDLIAFPLENQGLAKPAIRERVDALIHDFGLNALRGRRVLTLSGGERRMVALAAALAGQPRYLVLDEPTTGLDPAAAIRLVSLLERASTDRMGILITEENAAPFEKLAGAVQLLKDGRLTERRSTADCMADAAVWAACGLIAPANRLKRLHRMAAGQERLVVQGVRTRLRRGDGQPVLANAGFRLRAGEIVGLIGRNGAGKTTLFQALLGLAPVVAGRIEIDGADAQGWTVARRARTLAYLPQNMRRVLFNMTVQEEVLFAVTAGGPVDDDARNRASQALETYGLTALAQANPFALSARQQGLLGLACADAAQAAVAILDEPLFGRDVRGRQMLDTFLQAQRGRGGAVLIISHDLDMVDDVAERLLVLDGGAITYDGDTRQAWSSSAFAVLGWPAPRHAAFGEAA